MNKPKRTDCINEYFEDIMNIKKYFHNGDMQKAREHYYKLNDILNNKLDYIEKEEKDKRLLDMKKQLAFNEFSTMIDCLTYEELYTLSNHKQWLITDCIE